jgi:hypothetical protein
MNVHKNARLTAADRALMADRIEQGWAVSQGSCRRKADPVPVHPFSRRPGDARLGGRGASFGYTDAGRLHSAAGPWGADT